PVSVPVTGPRAAATSATAASTRSGGAAPGNGSRFTTVTCSSGTSSAAITGLPGISTPSGGGDDADHVEGAEPDGGPYQGGGDERVGVALHADDRAGGNPGQVRRALGRAERHRALADARLGVGGEQAQPQQAVAHALPGDGADLLGPGDAHPDAGGGVDGEPHRGPRVLGLDDAADEALGADHHVVGAHPVAGA